MKQRSKFHSIDSITRGPCQLHLNAGSLIQPLVSLRAPTWDKTPTPTEQFPTNPTYALDISTLTLHEEISRGGFAYVQKASLCNKLVAVKKLIKQRENNLRDKKKIVREMGIMCTCNELKIQGVVELVGFDLENYAIAMELMEGGDLYKMLHQIKLPITSEQKLHWAVQLASAVANLHSNGLIHTDLKSLNILLSADHTVLKICDLTDVMPATTKHFEPHGTPFWMAPEVIRHESCSAKSDVFSMGIILWEIYTRQKPYTRYNALEVIELVGSSDSKIPFRMDIPATSCEWEKRYVKIIEKCWNEEPDDRPTAAQVRDLLAEIVV